MASLHIRRFNSPMSLLLFLWNNIYFVFCTFKVSLFALNHECTCWSSLFETTSLLSDVISSKQQTVLYHLHTLRNNIVCLNWANHLYISKTKGVQVLTLVGLHYEYISCLKYMYQIGHIVSDFQDSFSLDLSLHHICHNAVICSVEFHDINCQKL